MYVCGCIYVYTIVYIIFVCVGIYGKKYYLVALYSQQGKAILIFLGRLKDKKKNELFLFIEKA